jgi:hypothetical protein
MLTSVLLDELRTDSTKFCERIRNTEPIKEIHTAIFSTRQETQNLIKTCNEYKKGTATIEQNTTLTIFATRDASENLSFAANNRKIKVGAMAAGIAKMVKISDLCHVCNSKTTSTRPYSNSTNATNFTKNAIKNHQYTALHVPE